MKKTKKKIVKKKKVVKKEWPQNLSKADLIEQYQQVESEIDSLENEAFELRRECERRKIDPWQ